MLRFVADPGILILAAALAVTSAATPPRRQERGLVTHEFCARQSPGRSGTGHHPLGPNAAGRGAMRRAIDPRLSGREPLSGTTVQTLPDIRGHHKAEY
jgi:hypothetical protein